MPFFVLCYLTVARLVVPGGPGRISSPVYLILRRDGSSRFRVWGSYFIPCNGGRSVEYSLHDSVGFPWGDQDCPEPLYFKSVCICRLSKYEDDQASVSTSVSWES